MVHVMDKDGFEIHFEALPEDISKHEHFVNQCGWTEEEFTEYQGYTWFCAKVSAHKAGIELCSVYLYETEAAFYTADVDGIFANMVNEAITEAKAKLVELNKD